MKRLLMTAVCIAALGLAAPASAADMAVKDESTTGAVSTSAPTAAGAKATIASISSLSREHSPAVAAIVPEALSARTQIRIRLAHNSCP